MNSFRYIYSSFNNFMNTIYIYNNNNNQMNYQMTNCHLVGISYLAPHTLVSGYRVFGMDAK